MYTRFSFGGENSMVGKMFATPSTSVETILNHKGVSEYLQAFADPAATPRSILSFVEREMPVLLDYARQTHPAFSASGSLRGHNDSLANSQNDSARLTSPSHPTVTSPVSDGAGAADGQMQSPLSSSSSSRPLLNGITGVTTVIRHPRRRLSSSGGAAADSAGRPSSGSESEEGQRASGSLNNFPARAFDKTLASINATELLSVYVAAKHAPEALREIVPVALAMLAAPSIQNTALATSVQRLLLAAFDVDFVVTTEVINATLDNQLVAGCVKSLCGSSIVVETIIALFGSALSAVIMMAPTTNTTLFTVGWIQNGFIDHICAAHATVLEDPSQYNYFYFVKEMLKRGFSHSAGPVVDTFLSYRYLGPMVADILAVAERNVVTVHLDAARHSAPTRHLAGEGLAVWSYAVGMLRKSLPVTETCEMYQCTTEYISPVRLVQENAGRLVTLLVTDLPHLATKAECLPMEPPVTPCQFAGLVRLSTCTLFVELAQYQVAHSDAIVVTSGFMSAFPRVCRAFPRNDTLSRLLHTFVLNIFHRQPLLGETVSEAASRDVLLAYLVSEEQTRQGLVSQLVEFAREEAIQTLSLSTFAIDALVKIAITPWCATEQDGPLSAAVQPFFEDSAMQKRLRDMSEPITGIGYRTRGSAGLPRVTHHATLNFATAQVPRALSLSTSTEDSVATPAEATDVAVVDSQGSPTNGTSDAGPYAVVPFVSASPPEELIPVEINLEDVHRETQSLKEHGSPQLQAYPNFALMQLSFGSNEDGDDAARNASANGPKSPSASTPSAEPRTEDVTGSPEVSAPAHEDKPGSEAAAPVPETTTAPAPDAAPLLDAPAVVSSPEESPAESASATAAQPLNGAAAATTTEVPMIVQRHAGDASSDATRPPPVRKKMPANIAAESKANTTTQN